MRMIASCDSKYIDKLCELLIFSFLHWIPRVMYCISIIEFSWQLSLQIGLPEATVSLVTTRPTEYNLLQPESQGYFVINGAESFFWETKYSH